MSGIEDEMIQVSVMAARDPKTGKYTAIPLFAKWDDLLAFSEAARDYIAGNLQNQAGKRDTDEGD